MGITEAKVKIPEIGDFITVAWGLELAKYYQLDHIVERLEKHPERYRGFYYDGCSMIDDRMLGILTKSRKWKDITDKCCCPHDIGYAYGDPDNEEEERLERDLEFKKGLKKVMRWHEVVKLFFKGVRIGGKGCLKQSYSWAFAVIK